jgi:hypothetical protein
MTNCSTLCKIWTLESWRDQTKSVYTAQTKSRIESLERIVELKLAGAAVSLSPPPPTAAITAVTVVAATVGIMAAPCSQC